MKHLILNPLIAPVSVIFIIGSFFMTAASWSASDIFTFSDTLLTAYTYMAYGLAFLVMILLRKDYQTETEKNTFLLCGFLFLCALLREAGVQHWLTSTDTTAFKLSFFKNPHNPLSEKVFSAYILFIVACVVGILLVTYTPKIIKGFFKLNPFYWTICTLGVSGIICKIADRIPANIRKMTGIEMNPQIHAWIQLLEETSEACLPLLCALAFIQYHLTRLKTKNA